MKRFMIFAGEDYEVRGGMDDFICDAGTKKKVLQIAETLLTERKIPNENLVCDWIQIYDMKNECHVFEKELKEIEFEVNEKRSKGRKKIMTFVGSSAFEIGE